MSDAEEFPPANKTAIVTGGSSGIGRATCIALAAKNWNVTLTGRRSSELQETVHLMSQGDATMEKTLVVAGDINEEAFVAR
ncbi:hypothetical protein CBS101457_005857 [Exobasidium rhododendri]|nr:hypothetical protein CBS101457_005857 [Exobasidium rhododendri]